MRVTKRDVSLMRDLALSHVMSRDQIIEVGYFDSVTRVNTRLRELMEVGLVVRLETPFHRQSLYIASKRASDVLGERISPLILNRAPSPRFVQHALAVTNVRLALLKKSAGQWRFEQQLWRKLPGRNTAEIRPDGLHLGKVPIFVEVDMGHVAPSKFKEKLVGYCSLATSAQCQSLYGFEKFCVLTVTTGTLRAGHLANLLPPDAGFSFLAKTFEEVGAISVSSWS